jgi:hypothetical protein
VGRDRRHVKAVHLSAASTSWILTLTTVEGGGATRTRANRADLIPPQQHEHQTSRSRAASHCSSSQYPTMVARDPTDFQARRLQRKLEDLEVRSQFSPPLTRSAQTQPTSPRRPSSPYPQTHRGPPPRWHTQLWSLQPRRSSHRTSVVRYTRKSRCATGSRSCRRNRHRRTSLLRRQSPPHPRAGSARPAGTMQSTAVRAVPSGAVGSNASLCMSGTAGVVLRSRRGWIR